MPTHNIWLIRNLFQQWDSIPVTPADVRTKQNVLCGDIWNTSVKKNRDLNANILDVIIRPNRKEVSLSICSMFMLSLFLLRPTRSYYLRSLTDILHLVGLIVPVAARAQVLPCVCYSFVWCIVFLRSVKSLFSMVLFFVVSMYINMYNLHLKTTQVATGLNRQG